MMMSDEADRQMIPVGLWAERSKRNEVCGILGCLENPTTQCPHCGLHYCDEHKSVIDGPGHQRGSV